MIIKDGGQLEHFSVKKLNKVRISKGSRRSIELWLNEDSVSYLTVEEALDLKDEINSALIQIITDTE